MSEYEIVFLTRSEDRVIREELIKEITRLVEAGKGKIIDTQDWGKKKLAYPIKKETEANFTLISFQSDTTTPNEITSKFNLREDLLRFMIALKQDSKVDIHA